MAQMLDLFVIGSPPVGIENGDRGAEGDTRRAAHRLSDAHGESADLLAETDIRSLDGLTVDQLFSNELDDLRILGEDRVIESVGAAQTARMPGSAPRTNAWLCVRNVIPVASSAMYREAQPQCFVARRYGRPVWPQRRCIPRHNRADARGKRPKAKARLQRWGP
jgi:hypothetical protein